MKRHHIIMAGAIAVLTLSSACPKPFNFESKPGTSSIWVSNGKVTEISATISASVLSLKDETYDICAMDKFGAYARVWADKKLVWSSDIIQAGEDPVKIKVNISGAKEIILENLSIAWYDFTKTLIKWENVSFTGGKDSSIKPYKGKTGFEQLGILTPEEKPEPQFNGPDIWGVRPSHQIIFRVPVSGERPMKFTAKGLPDGVTFDAGKGILGGVAPSKTGRYDILVVAENSKGKAEKTIRLQVGDTIALTPPLGWNSWNRFTYLLTAEDAKSSAVALEKSGLANYGYSYINLDDYWQRNNSGHNSAKAREAALGKGNLTGPARDENGKILPNKSFPDMKGLADYIHSFGFKAGLYSSPGPLTCGSCEGSYGHELQDAETWAEWGFDYIKYDWCSYRNVFDLLSKDEPSVAQNAWIHPYNLMNSCLKAQNRDILFSYCQYGRGNAHDWVRKYGANCWRTWSDLKDSWGWLLRAIESHCEGEFWKYCGVGCWPDPDMLVVGQQLSFGSIHPSFLTPNEQYTHISIWAMLSAPLLIGCDLTNLDSFTYSLLANPNVLAINQDRLGKVARRYVKNDDAHIWARPLANGDWAIALENLYPKANNISFDLSTLGLDGEWKVLDCWSGKEESNISGKFSYTVPVHATKLIRISKQ